MIKAFGIAALILLAFIAFTVVLFQLADAVLPKTDLSAYQYEIVIRPNNGPRTFYYTNSYAWEGTTLRIGPSLEKVIGGYTPHAELAIKIAGTDRVTISER